MAWNDAPPTKEELNWADTAPTPEELGTHEAPGAIESTARGVEQGALAGFGDEANAGLLTAKDKLASVLGLGGSTKDIIDLYRQHRDAERAAMDAAQKEHPYLYGAGQLAGGVGAAAATGGGSLAEQGLGRAVNLGAKYGALQALGDSNTDLTQGNDVDNALQVGKDVVTGAVTGGLTGIVGHAIGTGFNKAIGTTLGLEPAETLKNAFTQGAEGRSLVGVNASRQLGTDVNNLLDNQIGNTLNVRANELKAAKEAYLQQEGPPVNIKDWFQDTLQSLSNAKKSVLGADPNVVSDIDTVAKRLESYMMGNPEAGLPPQGFVMPAGDAEMFQRDLGSLGLPDDTTLKSNHVKEIIRRLVPGVDNAEARNQDRLGQILKIPSDFESLQDLVNQSRPGLDRLDQQISTLVNSKNNIPTISDLANYEKTGLSSAASRAKIDDFVQNLPNDLKQQYGDQIFNLAKAAKVNAQLNSPTINPGFLEKSTKGLVYGSANLAGQGAGAVGRGFGELYEMAPEALKDLGSLVKQKVATPAADALGSILSQAGDKDRLGRNALFFAIQQNPAYRAILNHVSGEEKVDFTGHKIGEDNSGNPSQ